MVERWELNVFRETSWDGLKAGGGGLMDATYLIRYGLTAEAGQFVADPGTRFERGQTVVIRSHRGAELGEVLLGPQAFGGEGFGDEARVERLAGPDDLGRAGLAARRRVGQFEACRKVLNDGVWPVELIDVEPLLDDRRTVLHYLGPHRLDTSGLLAVFRESCGLDVVFFPVGPDVSDPNPIETATADDHGCGGGCRAGGGGCSGSGSGCEGCSLRGLTAARR